MRVPIESPQIQTLIFAAIFIFVAVLSIRKKKDLSFDIGLTNELKGFAILAVIFGHIGYFLSEDNQFLFPLSVLSGVGVNLFLFLSGFGLAISSLDKNLNILSFYKTRLLKLFIPLWIVIFLLLVMDFFILQRTYDFGIIVQNLVGWYPRADVAININSPLWFITLIIYFYLIFPLLFWKRFIYISALVMLTTTFFLLKLPLPTHPDVVDLYKLHYIAFPLGVAFVYFYQNQFFKKIGQVFLSPFILRALASILLLGIFAYTAYYSGVGQGMDKEQTISIVTVFSVVFLFLLKNFEVKLFALFGIYSYEVYLIHWPLLYRYDLLFKFMPPFLAVLFYLVLFLVLSYLLQKADPLKLGDLMKKRINN